MQYLPPWGVLMLDLLLCTAAFWLSIWIGSGIFDYKAIGQAVLPFGYQYLLVITLQLLCFWAFHSYMGILRYSEDGVPHFVSFFRSGGGFRFFNVNDGLEDYVCSMEGFFERHIDRVHYVSVFTLED